MSAAPQDDEARWAQAQSLLDRVADESAEQRMRRARRTRLLIVVSIVLAMTAAGLVVALLLVDRGALRSDRDVPTWQAVGGLVVSGLGLVWIIAVLVVQIRITRRVQGWRSPLYALTRGQRKELLAQVRERGHDHPERVPLARHMAQLLLLQQLQWVTRSGRLCCSPVTG